MKSDENPTKSLEIINNRMESLEIIMKSFSNLYGIEQKFNKIVQNLKQSSEVVVT